MTTYTSDNPRLVSDILRLPDGDSPVAFLQIGLREGRYQPICPWCGADVGTIVDVRTIGELFFRCLEVIGPHVVGGICPNNAVDQAKMAVKIPGGSIGKPPII